MFTWIVLVLLAIIGVADLTLAFTKQKTISQRYHKLFPQWLDLVIMIALLAVIWIFLGVVVFVPIVVGTVLGHLAWHGDN